MSKLMSELVQLNSLDECVRSSSLHELVWLTSSANLFNFFAQLHEGTGLVKFIG